MYNKGNIVGCEEVYKNVMNMMLNHFDKSYPNPKSSLPKIYKQLLITKSNLLPSDGINVRNSMSDKNAWMLRHCFDEIIELIEKKTKQTGQSQ